MGRDAASDLELRSPAREAFLRSLPPQPPVFRQQHHFSGPRHMGFKNNNTQYNDAGVSCCVGTLFDPSDTPDFSSSPS